MQDQLAFQSLTARVAEHGLPIRTDVNTGIQALTLTPTLTLTWVQ